MPARILLALAICVCNAHLAVQMGLSAAAQGSTPQTQQELEMPCEILTDIQNPGGVINVSRVRIVNGERMCTVPANQVPQTMDEVLEGDELGAGAYAGLVPQCDGVLLNKDMCLTRRQSEMIEQYRRLDNFHHRRWKRKALSSVTAKWRNNVVPYEITDNVFSASEKALIESAMREWERKTCITFRPATRSDTDKVVIQSGMGCYSRIGRVGGSQELSLGTGICRTKRVAMHEMGHALGLIHEHQRDDRDNYVRIVSQNVQTQYMNQFDKISRSIVDVESTKYDYRSLMHYGKSFFSTDGSVTIQTIDPNYQDVIGRVDTLSFSDYKSINLMYQCAESCPQRAYCVDGGYVGPNCVCECPDGTTSCTATTGPPTGPNEPGPVRPGPVGPGPVGPGPVGPGPVGPGPVGPGPVGPGPVRPGPVRPGPIGPPFVPRRRLPIRPAPNRRRQPLNRDIRLGPRRLPFPFPLPPFLVHLYRNLFNRLNPHFNEHSTGEPEQLQGQDHPHYRVVNRQVANGRNIVHLSTSNVTAAIQAIMDAQKKGEGFLSSQNNPTGQVQPGQSQAAPVDPYARKSQPAAGQDVQYREQSPPSRHGALDMAVFPQDVGFMALEGLL